MLVERVEKLLERIERTKELRAFLSLNPAALEDAKRIQTKISSGKAGRLAGKVIGVKDNICVRGMPCTSASRVLENYVAPYDATVIKKLKAEDALIIGKTNMDEFANGSAGVSGAFGPTLNPLDTSKVPGGTSGGSGAACAAGLVDMALGSDTGGSVRAPAAFCGICALRPTYGAVSRYGLSDMTMSMDQIGPMAKSADELKLMFDVIRGKDENDAVSMDYALRLDGKTIGRPAEFFDERIDEKILKPVEDALSWFEDNGAKLVDISLPVSKRGVPIYYIIVFSEFASAMQKFDGFKYGYRSEEKGLITNVSASRNDAFGKEVKRRVLLGTYVTMKDQRDSWYGRALAARQLVCQEFASAFKKVDLIMGPAMPVLPWGQNEKLDDPVANYMADILTVQQSLAGVPAGVVPCGKVGRLPVGLQITGPVGGDHAVLKAMADYQNANALDFELDGGVKWSK